MSKVRVSAFSISLDGYGAGPDQNLQTPLGVGGEQLHEWFFPTRTFQGMYGDKPGTEGADNDLAAKAMDNLGAWIMGRNMFGPVRGEWPDEKWQGWWGDVPPYHCDVFVLTHHKRRTFEMDGGTTFHFITGGIEQALERARAAAKDRDIRIGGGVATIREYLKANLIDEMHLAVAPVVLGRGEHLLQGIDLKALGFEHTDHVATAKASHHVLARRR
ncbi:MAG TPA: dihydrofolate reductase family protein [Hyphomonadaceae bacterium]|nr:dihydrofolate reductase family protein [Hyphomonadaceae bacterium]